MRDTAQLSEVKFMEQYLMSPLISVVMPVYNCADYLREAIDSVLNQSLNDFEFIIIDDASTDQTTVILDSYTDTRIVPIRNPQNIGVAETLNIGLDVARGKYIARMDGDDISDLDRFKHQIDYLEKHLEVGCLSSNMISIDSQGKPLFGGKTYYDGGATPPLCCWELLWSSPIPHNAVMLRRETLYKHNLRYDPELNTVEDYDLWSRLAQYTQIVRVPDVLVYRRLTTTNVSRVLRERQLNMQLRVVQRELTNFWDYKIDEAAARTILYTIGHEPILSSEIPAATKFLMATRQRYLKQVKLSTNECKYIDRQVTNYLLRMAKQAKQVDIFYPLWELRQVSRREFFSRNAIKLLIKAFTASR